MKTDQVDKLIYQPLVNAIVARIREVRKQKGISQESIAYFLDIDYSTYGKIERRKLSLSVDRLLQIADFIDVDLYYLLTGSDVPSINYII